MDLSTVQKTELSLIEDYISTAYNPHFRFYELHFMQFSQMPLFDVFLPVIQENTVRNWTSNDFWLKIRLPHGERNRFNRQRMYRILRKLVELVFLEKQVNHSNHKFSRFNETEKTIELKCFGKPKNEFSNMVLEENKINEEITFLEKQTEKYFQLEKNFPSLSRKISYEKSKCLSKITCTSSNLI